MTTGLGLDPDDLAQCVGCGLCLPHCPTWRVSGDEALSPRGRIGGMRLVEAGALEPDAGFLRSIDTCVQCRGCEPACPAGVPFGRLMEGTRATLERQQRRVPRWERWMLRALGRHRLVLAGSTALGVGQRLHLVPRRLTTRLGLPARVPLRRPKLASTGDDVWLFTGCVMDAWQRDVHAAAIRVVHATGHSVALPGAAAACCGALHVHAGLADDARALARRVMAAMPGDSPILVDSAGCGAALQDYGHLLGTDEAATFAARVRDVHGWIADHAGALPARRSLGRRVAVQDPCHLRHVQRDHLAVRTVLDGVVAVVELDDEGLCCGAGGAYSVQQPELASEIRDRKLTAIARSGAELVVSANPGCSLHLAAAGVDVRHPVELLAASLEEE